jgi:hypothetical protein
VISKIHFFREGSRLSLHEWKARDHFLLRSGRRLHLFRQKRRSFDGCSLQALILVSGREVQTVAWLLHYIAAPFTMS